MKEYRLYLYALDPTHIGSGGYRIGRVDNTVLRDAGTGLPKIPATALSGNARTAAIYVLDNDDQREKARRYARDTIDRPNAPRPHSGSEDPVAKYFGYAEAEKGGSRIGIVSFRDAHILAFPVPTMAGPRWISTQRILSAVGCACPDSVVPQDIAHVSIQRNARARCPARIDLGSYLLEAVVQDIAFPSALSGEVFAGVELIKERLVLVHEDLFSSLVNANLETRTSVSIDFETGAAAAKRLFTSEATPRGTLFFADISIDDDRFPGLAKGAESLLERSMALACRWGIGGMTTRGFGRMRCIILEKGGG